eukprot:TRINITY_DN2009_c0_g1_i4.p1 TRINITY_DN2009_c0_g1~~TRINITY_DN2009_c0_g1_i4.p1  ORF type:complete len:170 (-),score=51.86 TRINITY_DN2009_c0_g1_i4:63-572(-)
MAEQDPESLESEAPPQGPKLPLDVTVADLRSLLQLLRSPEDALKIHATRSLLLYAQGDAKCFASVIKLGVGIAEGTIMLPRAEDGALSEEEELLWRVNEYGCVAFFASFLEQSDGLRLAGLEILAHLTTCLLYTSDAADEEDSVDLGGRRIIKKKKKNELDKKCEKNKS